MPPTSAVTPARDRVRARAGPMMIVTLLLATAATAGDEPASPAGSTIRGRVVDEGGKAVPGARVRLYRRASQWDRRNAVIEEATAGPTAASGSRPGRRPRSRPVRKDLTRLVLLADKPGLAVGWRIIPDEAKEFAGDVTLTAVRSRGRSPSPTPTAAPSPARPCRPTISATPPRPRRTSATISRLRPGEPPLTAVTDAEGRARFAGLPRTKASFVASGPGFAETFAFDGQTAIRLTPSATLSGTVTGPDGKPVAGTTVVLQAEYMWEFHSDQDRRAGTLSVRRPRGPRLGHVGVEAGEGRQRRVQALARGRPPRRA